MQMKKFLMALLCVLLSATTALAQNNVTGTVVDETGEPVIGASVMVQGTKTGTGRSGGHGYDPHGPPYVYRCH